MKRNIKIKLISTLMIITILLSYINVYATDTASLNMETASLSSLAQVVESIINGFVNHDSGFINKNTALFTSPCFDRVNEYTYSNNINGRNIDNILVDFTYPNGSSTEDTVILANAKIKYLEYSKLYLFEFHIDENGDIYGINAWQY